ncbi:MAG: substrate-binding domain-containing protein [Gemmatimonadaceae bacterium]|nr:substrate-binding domain-containing protein [Gemmatimonadaceae bacterium]
MISAGIRRAVKAAVVAALFAPLTPWLGAQAPAADTESAASLRVYGPGGPAPAVREAAALFGARKGITVIVSAGPTPAWKDQAAKDADLVYSGSEYMMTDFVRRDLPGVIDTSTIRTLYLRPSALLVRRGNPKGITSIRDLTKPGVKVLVVEGAGQVGMWEDVAGRTGDARLVGDIRRHIGAFAANSAEAKKLWNGDPSYDAWLIWTIWQKESPASADLVSIEPEHTVYRSAGIAVTNRSALRNVAGEFADFLESVEGRAIFHKWGWTTSAP